MTNKTLGWGDGLHPTLRMRREGWGTRQVEINRRSFDFAVRRGANDYAQDDSF